jgi:hypothetical protein
LAGAGLLFWGAQALLALVFLGKAHFLFQGVSLYMTVFYAAPALVLAALRRTPYRDIFWPTALAMLALLLALTVQLFLQQPDVRAALAEQLAAFTQQIDVISAGKAAPPSFEKVLRYVPGLSAAIWFALVLSNLWLVQSYFRPHEKDKGGSSPYAFYPLRSVGTPMLVSLVAVVSSLLVGIADTANFSGGVHTAVLSIFLVSLCPLAIVGLAVVQTVLVRRQTPRPLRIFLVVLLVIEPLFWVLLALVGAVEPLLRLREKSSLPSSPSN